MTVTADAKKRVVLPGASPGDGFHVREDRAGNVTPASLSPKGQKENDEKAGFGGYRPLEIHSSDELGETSQAYP